MGIIPKTANDEARLEAARIIAQRLIDEANVTDDLEVIAKDIAEHCRYGDGFQMAKDLESAYWSCDTAMVEVLDDYSYQIEKAHEKYLKQYAIDNAIEPPLPVGARVKVSAGTGVITSIYEYRPLSYTVKMDGDEKAEPPTNRRSIIWFDQVELLTPQPEGAKV
jgi:hypothetical protein